MTTKAQRDVWHLFVEDLQLLPPHGMVALQDAKSVMGPTWDQFQAHPVKISKSRALMWATGIQPEMGRKSKRPHPGRFQTRNLHVSRLLSDGVVHLIPGVFVQDGEHSFLFAIPFDVEGVDADRVAEVWCLSQSCHSYWFWFLFAPACWAPVLPGNLDEFLGELPLFASHHKPLC